jgi:hypothetical protein
MSSQPVANIDVGAVFERVLNTYAKTWQTLLLGALIVFAPIALLFGLLIATDSGAGAFLVLAATIIGTFWYQGMVVETVRDVQDGTLDNSVGQLFRSVTPVLGTLIGVGFLAVLGLIVGFILLIIPGLILLTIWAVVAPVVVIERTGVIEAFGRSRALVRGNGWQVFGVLVALFALNIALSIVVSIIGAAGDGAAAVAQLIQYVVFAPVSALAASIIYFALREAHGDAALQQPTGVLTGGFTPPVPPAAPSAPVAPVAPEAPAAGGFSPPAAPAAEAPAAPEPAPVEPAGEAVAAEPAPAEPAAAEPVPAEPAAAEPEPTEPPPERLPDPHLGQPSENTAAENAFGAAEPGTGEDAFGQPAERPPDPPKPRDPGQSIPPPGWKDPSGG